jgi:glycosyltransferase involved in cell wall biosynthesis
LSEPVGVAAPTPAFSENRLEFMKFSVLLPTRNRLEYLRYAIETVRRQDYSNWEIIVSDNCSEDDIEGYIRSLDDARIVYLRTASFLPVTDNWNNALDRSTGDYVVMLGDDDGLLPGYFSTMLRAFESFPDPDFVYVSALFFAYPGVMPDWPDGFLREDRNRVFTESEAFLLDTGRARDIARGYLDFRMPVASNMQFSLVSRRKIEEFLAKGPFFQSPYPDFYATPALFLTSDRILIYPRPLVVIGITPKSYGYFHFNNRASDGVEFLNNAGQLAEGSAINATMLPGTSYNDSWLLAMEALRANFAAERAMFPAYRRYRFLQIVHGYKRRYFDRTIAPGGLRPLQARMTVRERLYGFGLSLCFSGLRLIPFNVRNRMISRLRRAIGQHAMSESAASQEKFANLIEVYESILRQSPGPAAPVALS